MILIAGESGSPGVQVCCFIMSIVTSNDRFSGWWKITHCMLVLRQNVDYFLAHVCDSAIKKGFKVNCNCKQNCSLFVRSIFFIKDLVHKTVVCLNVVCILCFERTSYVLSNHTLASNFKHLIRETLIVCIFCINSEWLLERWLNWYFQFI